MNKEEYSFLLSEIAEIEAILAGIPASRTIDRSSFEVRLANAKERLSKADSDLLAKTAKLTFRGDPVVGSRGIAADFAAKAASAFTDAFLAINAGVSGALNYMGPIPHKHRTQLLITGTAVGSFGFVFELPSVARSEASRELALDDCRKSELAMQKLEALFELSRAGTDDDLSDLVNELHPRSVKKVSEFLDCVAENNAWCSLDFDSKQFSFRSCDEVRSAALRLNSENIKEETQELEGEFIGTLPIGRSFEFRTPDGDVIKGKLGLGIEQPSVINQNYLHVRAKVRLDVLQVGAGRPRYTLLSINDIMLLPRA